MWFRFIGTVTPRYDEYGLIRGPHLCFYRIPCGSRLYGHPKRTSPEAPVRLHLSELLSRAVPSGPRCLGNSHCITATLRQQIKISGGFEQDKRDRLQLVRADNLEGKNTLRSVGNMDQCFILREARRRLYDIRKVHVGTCREEKMLILPRHLHRNAYPATPRLTITGSS
jgi:hypothetical protein